MQAEEAIPHPIEIIGEARVVQLRLESEARTARVTLMLFSCALLTCLGIAFWLMVLIALPNSFKALDFGIQLLPGAAVIVLFCTYRLLLAVAELRSTLASVESILRIHQNALYDAEQWERVA
jgi:hypothetical protein